MNRAAVASALALAATLPGRVSAQGGAEGGGAALFDINVGLSAWTLIVFAALLVVLGKFAWGPILQAVEAREKGIQSALDEAAQRNEEAARLLADHKEQLADARRQSNQLIVEGRAAGESVRREIEEKARAEGQAIVERARGEIHRERDAALEALRRESVELALAAASRLIRENLDQPKDRALVEQYLAEVGRGGAEA
jgi:F-type H+-transporting ATPase subunit b